jgi:hypothetical protein
MTVFSIRNDYVPFNCLVGKQSSIGVPPWNDWMKMQTDSLTICLLLEVLDLLSIGI